MGERKFIEDGVRQRCRVDGRGLLVSRRMNVETGMNPLVSGSATLAVELRTPHVICAVKMDVTTPATAPHLGEVSLNVHITEARTALTKRQERDIEDALSHMQLRHINRAQLLILEKLRCWQVAIDVTVLDSDAGNLVEHVGMAVYAALGDTKVPKVRGYLNASSEEVTLEVEEGYWRLDLTDLPLIFTCWKVAGELVADVSGKEQQRTQGCLHISVSPSGCLCGMLKDKSGSFTLSEIALAADVAMRAVSLILASLQTGKVRYRIGQLK